MGNVARLEYLLCESGSAKVREAAARVEEGLTGNAPLPIGTCSARYSLKYPTPSALRPMQSVIGWSMDGNITFRSSIFSGPLW
jgi:hypothetical protein